MVLIFDNEGWLDSLAVDFRKHSFDVADSRAPRHVVSVWPGLIQVLEVERADPTFQLFKALDRIQARAEPVAGVGTGSNPFAASLACLQYRIRVPVV